MSVVTRKSDVWLRGKLRADDNVVVIAILSLGGVNKAAELLKVNGGAKLGRMGESVTSGILFIIFTCGADPTI